MALSDLFKSKAELEKEKKREQRAQERKVERAIESNKERAQELEKEQKKLWASAVLQMQQGNRSAAERLVLQYKAKGASVSRFQKQAAWAENQLNNIRGAMDTQAVGQALTDLVAKVDLSPDLFAENLDVVNDAGADIADLGREFDKAYAKDEEKILASAAADGSSLANDPLMIALEKEAAVGITGERKAVESMGQSPSVPEDINAGRDRLKALLKD